MQCYVVGWDHWYGGSIPHWCLKVFSHFLFLKSVEGVAEAASPWGLVRSTFRLYLRVLMFVTQFFINLSLRHSQKFSSWWLLFGVCIIHVGLAKQKSTCCSCTLLQHFSFEASDRVAKIKKMSGEEGKYLLIWKCWVSQNKHFTRMDDHQGDFFVSRVWLYLKSWRCVPERQNTSGIFGLRRMIEPQSPSLVLGLPLHGSLCM